MEFKWTKTLQKFVEGFIMGAITEAVIVLQTGSFGWKSLLIPTVIGGLRGVLNIYKNSDKF